jgi:uncharacterized protein YjaG (DUF416 family)
MNTLRYDEQQVIDRLHRVSQWSRGVFAASCAQRLLSASVSLLERQGKAPDHELADVLERLWSDLEGRQMSKSELEQNLERCMCATYHHEDKQGVAKYEVAEDTVAAVAYALRCRLNGQEQEAAWAARRVYEALDEYVITSDGIDINRPRGELRVLSHPVVQAELIRQRRDMDELVLSGVDNPRVAAKFRERANMEGLAFFGQLS